MLSVATRARTSIVHYCNRISRPLSAYTKQVYNQSTPDFKDLSHLDGEYTKPKVQTSTVPGPMAKHMMDKINSFQLASTVQIFTNYEKSCGNYMVDADDNILLDLYQQVGSLALGYNNPTVLASIEAPINKSLIASRPALGFAPPVGYIEQLQSTILSVSPKGMNNILPMMCGSCSNENALKLAFMWYMNRRRGKDPITLEEMESAEMNQSPGCPKISVLSFQGSFHGRTACLLSVTHTKPLYKLDIPVFDWPIAPFPQLKYPLEDYVNENKQEERRCLEQVEELFDKYNKEKNCPIAAAIIEPIQSEGGDKHASSEFFRSLQNICKKNGTAFIVDEVQTGGGGTGRMWAHEEWDLPEPPHLVTFAKKLQMAGMYAVDGMFPEQAFRIYNTWMGDPSKTFVIRAILEEMRKHDLLEVVKLSGSVLLQGLKETEKQYPNIINSSRGIGTYCAFSTTDNNTCVKLVQKLRNKGFMVGPSGSNSIRFRPALIFQPKHAHIFINGLHSVLADM